MSSIGHSSTTTTTSTDSHSSTLRYPTFRAPPPTVNRLSARQKAQLRRTTTKLAKVLGEAPQVVDDEVPSRIAYTHLSAPKKLQPSLSITSSRSRSNGANVRRARSATATACTGGRRVDPDLYPLSSALRPASCDVPVKLRRSTSSRSSARRSSESEHRRHSRSLRSSSEFTFLLDENDNYIYECEDGKGKASFVIVSPRPQKDVFQPRPESVVSTTSRDSLYDYDYDYEPTFRIPSAIKLRREKMARVQKLLGEDVPVELVFPVSDSDCDDDLPNPSPAKDVQAREGSDSVDSGYVVLDICAATTPQRKEIDVDVDVDIPPPTPPKFEIKRKPVPAPPTEASSELPPLPPKPDHLHQHQHRQQQQQESPYQNQLHLQLQAQQQVQQPRWPTAYRASHSRPNLETIIELEHSTTPSMSASPSPRGSYSSADSNTNSICSLLSGTTSSSYRFTSPSSACVSSLECVECVSPLSSSSSAHDENEIMTPASTPNKDSQIDVKRAYEMSSGADLGMYGRREFAIYVPFRRSSSVNANVNRVGSQSCQAEFNAKSQECDIVRSMLDLRV